MPSISDSYYLQCVSEKWIKNVLKLQHGQAWYSNHRSCRPLRKVNCVTNSIMMICSPGARNTCWTQQQMSPRDDFNSFFLFSRGVKMLKWSSPGIVDHVTVSVKKINKWLILDMWSSLPDQACLIWTCLLPKWPSVAPLERCSPCN